jgi:MFS family permease
LYPCFVGAPQLLTLPVFGQVDFEEWTVTLSAGYGGGIILAVGSLLGGWACRRVRGHTAYLLAGGLTVVCSAAMALAPFRPVSYIVGGAFYYLAAGLCYGTFTSMVLEVVGDEDAGASTRYTLFTAAANVAIFYVTLLDGVGQTQFEKHWNAAEGPRGLLAMDGALNLVGIAVLLVLFRLFRPRRPALAAA